MSKQSRLERLANRTARQATQADLVDIYCILTGAFDFKGTVQNVRELLVAELRTREPQGGTTEQLARKR